MARKKDVIRRRYRSPVRVFTLPLIWVLILIAAVIGLILWWWDNLVFWALSAVSIIWALLGRGIVLVIIAMALLIGALLPGRPRRLIRRWYRWLGFFALITAFWGVLGLLGWGGSIGLTISGSHDTIGLLRIVGLAIAGIILMAPGAFLEMAENIVMAMGSLPRRLRFSLLVLMFITISSGLLFWQRSAAGFWGSKAVTYIWGKFGWGLPLIAVSIIIASVAVFRRELADLLRALKMRYWHRWLGGLALMLSLWGALALFAQGGSIGQGIIGYPAPISTGLLRVVGLFLLGIILLFPRLILSALSDLAVWVGDIKRGEPVLPSARQRKIPLPKVELSTGGRKGAVPEEVAPEMAQPLYQKREVAASEPSVSSVPTLEGLKQVAQEVWKKYGETSPALMSEGWRLPPVDILDNPPEIEFGEGDNIKRARLIEDALGSYGVEAKVVQINEGPTVTQFGVEPGWDRKMREVKEKDRDGSIKMRTEEVSRTRVKVERITSLANDLALALAAPSIRIEAPVPGKSMVGIEVPNTVFGLVSLRSVIESSSFQKLKSRAKLALALGKGAGGEAVAADLSRMPHLLIAGATGSGKTVCLNSIICCLLLHNTPYDIRFIMIDPKRVELTQFNGIPHMAAPVIVETDKAISTLRWLSQEMNNRYKKMAEATVRNIEGYNKNKTGSEKLPYLVLLIDELADLMMTGYEEVEHILCRLAQLARATGIHLVVATQRPSVDVVTGLIKANFPTRISFAVTSQVDSRTILDTTGAEKLLGRGDMLYMPTDVAKPKRLQGCFVSDAETERLVYLWSSQKSAATTSLNIENITQPVVPGRKPGFPTDPLLEGARQLAEEHKNISTSYLQRQLRIGYNRAARLMEMLQEEKKEGEEAGET